MGRCPLTALSGLRFGGGLVFKGWLGFRVKGLGSSGSRVWGFKVRGCRLKGLGLSCLKLFPLQFVGAYGSQHSNFEWGDKDRSNKGTPQKLSELTKALLKPEPACWGAGFLIHNPLLLRAYILGCLL